MEVELAQIIELNQKNASLKSVAMLETGNLGVDIIVDQGIAQYPQVGDSCVEGVVCCDTLYV